MKSVGACTSKPDGTSSDDDLANGILYEFLIHAEWPQDPELHFGKSVANPDDVQRFRSLRGWSLFGTKRLPTDLCRLIDGQLNWHFAVGGEGKLIALLQDHFLEIRSCKDDYATAIGKCSVGKDIHFQWRRLAWSPDCSLLAVSHSDGSVDFFDALANKIFTINSIGSGSQELVDALNSILFVESRVPKSHWSFEVLLIDYRGILRSYFINLTDGYTYNHTYNLTSFTNGSHVTAAVYDADKNLLVCGGPGVEPSLGMPSGTHALAPTAMELGVFAFRLLNDDPYYRLSLTVDEDKVKCRPSSFLQKLPKFLYSSKISDVAYRFCVSPDSNLLAVVHLSGAITIWHFPSLRFWKMFSLEQQSHSNVPNPVFVHSSKKCFAADEVLKDLVADVSWWSTKALIVAQCSGAVTVSSVNNFENLLGNSPEWFGAFPRVSAAHDRGFLVLESESRLSSGRRSESFVETDNGSEDEGEDDDGHDSIFKRSAGLVRTALYYMTDSERFQPPRRKPKFLMCTYRLLCLKATSPESLFARKLDNEEYGEALMLAQMYNLDCDLVYQRQWRNADVSIASIQDYLSKITKRSWVLHECLDRVPETLSANRALLEYGLVGTDLEALINIGDNTNDGKFVPCNSQYACEDDYINEFDFEAHARREVRQREARFKMLSKVNVNMLNLEQKQLCITRQKLLKYLKRLDAYQYMLGEAQGGPENFDSRFFREFRMKPAPIAATEFARQGNWRFVAAMFSYYGKETMPHRLAILSNFPETMSPFNYCSLLPEPGYKTVEPEAVGWLQGIRKENDWVTDEKFSVAVGNSSDDSAEFLYEDEPELKKFRSIDLNMQQLSDWYAWRANTVESRSRLVDHALELVRLGIERNVQGLTALHNDILTLEVLVYECFVDESLRLAHIREMKDIDKLRLLMSRSSGDQFVKNARRWLVPFLARCDSASQGSGRKLLREYLLSIAKHDLMLCVKLFDQSRIDQKDPIISPTNELISLALDCIYASMDDDQLNNAKTIVECLPSRSDSRSQTQALYDKFYVLEKHLSAVQTLQKHNIRKPIFYIRDCQNSGEEAKRLLCLLTRTASRQNPEVHEVHWKELLEDILDLQKNVFQSVDVKECLEIFILAMLRSGRKDIILLAGELLEGSKARRDNRFRGGGVFKGIGHHSLPKVSSEDACAFVILVAKEYFNAASDSDDPCMELARTCLCLVDEVNEAIQQELDLISAIPILNELGIRILPLQVRICENRLQLIEQVFSSKPRAYKNLQKLMKLAHLMRVGQDVRLWEGEVHVMVASAAFEAQDFDSCYQACQYILLQKYAKGWEVCLKLGQCDDFMDIQARHELLGFSSIYCCNDRLEDVVNTLHKLEVSSVQLRLQRLVPEMEGIDARRVTGNQRMSKLVTKLQELTNTATEKVLSTVRSSDVLDSNVSWPHRGMHLSLHGVNGHSNSSLDKISIPTFNETLLPDCFLSGLSQRYTEYGMPNIEAESTLSLGLLLLRSALLQTTIVETSSDAADSATECKSSKLMSSLLQDVACNLLPHDTLLGLAHLFILDDPILMEECFQRFPNNGTCLQLCLLCFSLQICREMKLIEGRKLYNSDANEIVKLALDFARANRKGSKPLNHKLLKYVELVLCYKKKLADFLQANVLLSLGRGVDVVRFSQDDEYKRETVLGLAMSTDDKTFNTALSLAKRYNISQWDLYMVHLEYWFCDDEVPTSEMEKRMTSLNLMNVLLEEAPKLRERLRNTVLVTIAGTDYPRFIFYLKLVEKSCEKDEAKRIQVMVRLLTKLQSIAPGLDFQKLVYGTDSLLSLLEPILCDTNIQQIVKILPSIKSVLGKSVRPSELFSSWLKKLFFSTTVEGGIDSESTDLSHKSNKKTHRYWITRYDACVEHFGRLDPLDLVGFVKGTIFTEKSLDDIALTTRSQMLSRTLKYSHTELEKSKPGSSLRNAWHEAVEQLVKDQKHLDWMNSELIEETKSKADSNVSHFLRQLELCGPDSASTVLFDCILDGQSVDLVQHLISVLPTEAGYDSTPGDVVIEVLSILQNIIRNVNDDRRNVIAQRNPIEALTAIIKSIFKHIEEGGDLVNMNDVMKQSIPICTDDLVDVSTRLTIIKLMERMCVKDNPHLATLIACKTRAMIESTWPNVQVTLEDLETDQGRECLFNCLLLESKFLPQFATLVELLVGLPPLESSNCQEYKDNCWCKIMASIFCTDDPCKHEAVVDALRQAISVVTLNLQCLTHIMDKFSQPEHFLKKVKFALLTKHETLHESVLEEASLLKLDEVMDLDHELCSLLLELRLVPRTLETPLYQSLVNYILAELNYDQVQDVANQLKDAGYHVEAASLLVRSSGLSVGLQCFNAALELLQKSWLP